MDQSQPGVPPSNQYEKPFWHVLTFEGKWPLVLSWNCNFLVESLGIISPSRCYLDLGQWHTYLGASCILVPQGDYLRSRFGLIPRWMISWRKLRLHETRNYINGCLISRAILQSGWNTNGANPCRCASTAANQTEIAAPKEVVPSLNYQVSARSSPSVCRCFKDIFTRHSKLPRCCLNISQKFPSTHQVISSWDSRSSSHEVSMAWLAWLTSALAMGLLVEIKVLPQWILYLDGGWIGWMIWLDPID